MPFYALIKLFFDRAYAISYTDIPSLILRFLTFPLNYPIEFKPPNKILTLDEQRGPKAVVHRVYCTIGFILTLLHLLPTLGRAIHEWNTVTQWEQIYFIFLVYLIFMCATLQITYHARKDDIKRALVASFQAEEVLNGMIILFLSPPPRRSSFCGTWHMKRWV